MSKERKEEEEGKKIKPEIYGMAGHLIRRLHQISDHLFQIKIKKAGFSLTPVQFSAMSIIHLEPGTDQAGVSEKIAYDRATIGEVIDRLESKGYVNKQVNSQDRRARQISLTDEGEKLFREIFPVVKKMQRDILSNLTDEEQKLFLILAKKASGITGQ